MEETFAVAPFVGGHPSLPNPPDFSLCEISGPSQSSFPLNFIMSYLRTNILSRKPLYVLSLASL